MDFLKKWTAQTHVSHSNKASLLADTGLMFHPEHIMETARYITRIHERRHPNLINRDITFKDRLHLFIYRVH